MTESRESLSVAQAAARLGVERMSAYRYIRSGALPAHKDGNGRMRVYPEDLEGVEVKPPGRPGTRLEHRTWTPAMIRRRARDWNDAVASGVFDDPVTGEIDQGLIGSWEIERGWTHKDLTREAKKLEKRLERKRKRDPFT